MDIGVLGPLQICGEGGGRIELSEASLRRLACFLLIRDGAVVSADALADGLGISPAALRASISRLRRILGVETVVSAPPGFALRADTLDARDFEHHLAAAVAVDRDSARWHLETALALWRGDAYGEFAHEEWAIPEATRLAELHTAAVEDLERLDREIATSEAGDRIPSWSPEGKNGESSGTFLATDIVGSTRLWAEQPEAMSVDLALHDNIVRCAIADFGGTTISRAGDSFVAIFQQPRDAIAAAIAAQGLLGTTTWRNSVGIRVRMGIHVGPARLRDDVWYGPPINETARIGAAAHGGQIVVSEAVSAMVPDVGVIDLHEHRLRDIDGTRHLFQVVAPGLERDFPLLRTMARPVPLPARLAVASQFGFVGRDRECETLRQAWNAVRAGERRVVLLSGEAGLGKTCISAEIAREAFAAGDLVMYGRCDEEISTPYRPFVEAMTHYVTHAGTGDIDKLGTGMLADLASMVPALRYGAPATSLKRRSGADGDQYALYSAVSAMLGHLASIRPVVFVLDDLHWADRGTLHLLRDVVAQIPAGRLFVVGTYRDTDVGADDPLTATLAALHRESGVERVDLGGLSDREILSMLETVGGHPMDADGVQLAHALRDETNGNPFFVGEMLRHLAENGSIARDADGRWVATVDLADVGLPQSVREVIGARVRRLGDDAHRVLSAAAVAGRDFDVSVAAEAGEVDVDLALDLLESASAAGLVAEIPGIDDRYTFTHALVQHTLYQDLRSRRRGQLHRKIAEAIEASVGDTGDRVDELATHWFAATRPGAIDKAITYGIRAGDRAMAARSPDDAARWYRQTLDVIADGDSRLRSDLMVRLGDALRQAGEAEHRDVLLAAAHMAQRVGARDLLVRSALANNRGWHSRTGVADLERIDVLEAALAAEPDDSPSRASLLALLAVEYSSAGNEMLERRLALADEAVAVARRVGDAATLAEVLDAGVFATWIPERRDERLAWSEEAVDLADSVGDPVLDYWASARREALALETHDRATFAKFRARQVALVERLGQPVMRWRLTCIEVTRLFLDGDLEGAEALATEALELGFSSGQPDALSYFGAQFVMIRGLQGRLGELEELIRQQAEANPGIPSFRVALASLCADGGRYDEGIAILADDVANGFSHFAKDPMWLLNITGAVRVAVVAGQAGHSDNAAALAHALYDLLAPFSDHIIYMDVLARPPVSHFLGVLAALLGRDAADTHFANALDIATRIEAPLFAAMTRVEWGAFRLARGQGDPEATRALVNQALATAIATGAGGIERRARQVIEQLS